MANYQALLQEIAEVQVGYQARGRIDEDLDGDFTIIRSTDFREGGSLDISEAMHFRPNRIIDPMNYLVSADDILFQARGANHLAYLITTPLENTVAANTFYIVKIRDKRKVLPVYLTWWINQPTAQAYFEQSSGVSTIPFVSKKDLLDAPVLIPPLETQKNISDLVNLWEREKSLLINFKIKKEQLIHAVARKAVADSLEEK